ncbi:transposase (plasmid) [Mesorhizobium sp. AR02]|uniref:IS66-like element accessory protein TnpA n=1 Tax=Mesorhizobium sp. AR02 TaxID=2865837 RepID=UPI00215F4188|nr:transposase [Mesorhizobium sp. AR02]UVK50307.1 transposase [Mesorhizobium sp. AR02]UVK50321.1 transposase [Mesorhizobium sp. AR02]UVK50338.1 transposase [Mesorhizobium sp. AR02]
MEDDEQKLLVRRILRNGRRRYDPASKERLVAACLEPGVSVSRLALEYGINANLLRKWIKTTKDAGALPPPAPSAFIPVQVTAADHSLPMQSNSVDRPAARGEERLSKSESMGSLPLPAKVSASLPNGVKLVLECGDVDALTAIIGALGHVQTGR